MRALRSGNHHLIPNLRNPYCDGEGIGYVVVRQDTADIAAYDRGDITRRMLLSRREIKWGESKDFDRRRPEYVGCTVQYELTWIATYTTPERKLSEGLIHETLRVRDADAPRVRCSCGKRHREWFSLDKAGGKRGVERIFRRWMRLRGHGSYEKIVLNNP
ncbi:hypothetical protein C8R46DRAFT_1220641 [Mycena filopes]|nr:hypothetical protein C8R46DRAFT_1220641 [Mycena filopes]